MPLSFYKINFKNLCALFVFMGLGASAYANESIDLPMKKILEAAKAKTHKQSSPFDNEDIHAPRDEEGRPVKRRTRVYTMSPLGMLTLNDEKVANDAEAEGLRNNQDPQREADAEDGDDITAFEEVGLPLDTEHLSEFKVCNNSRTEQGISSRNTYWMSALSAVAYLKYPLAFDRLKKMGFEEIIFIEGASDVEVFVAKKLPKRNAEGELIKDSGLTVISFRGTDDAEDWITNLEATSSNISEHNQEAWLHEGFALALDEVYAEIIKALDLKNNPSPLFFTGHSMGAALATQMVVRMVSKEDGASEPLVSASDDRIRGLYGFAVPRVGNLWARNILDKYMNRTRNVAVNIHNNADPTPKSPFDWLGYKRFGVQAVLPFDSKDQVDYGNRSTWVCHNDADYRGPGAFSSDLWYTTADAHYLSVHIKHFKPWRQQLALETSCEDPSINWGPRFQEQNPANFKPLQKHTDVGKNSCDYTALTWGGNVQL